MSARPIYEFGPFCLDVEDRLLRHGNELVPLTPKAYQTLLVLIENRDRIVDKCELLKLVWPDTYTEQSNLPHQILAIRKALAELHPGKQFIETIARRGYRFVGQVRVVDQQHATAESSQASVAQTGAYPISTDFPQYRTMHNLPTWRGVFLTALILLSVLAGAVFSSQLLKIRSANKISAVPERTKEARRQYEQGRFFWNKRTAADYRTAIAHFQEAIRLEPNYAEAYAGLADAYILLGSFGIESPNEVVPRARAAALRAIELDDRSAEAHASMAYLMSRFDWNWEQADREFRRALELDPKYTTAHHWYALHLITLGRTVDAISQIRTAQALDPGSLVLRSDTALVLFYARRYDEAVQECKKALEIDASFGLAHRTLAAIYAAQGKYLQAIAEFETATRLLGRDPWMIAEIGRSYARLGQRQQAMSRLIELHELAKTQFVSPSAFALLSASLEDRRDESFKWLEEEFDRHANANVAMLSVHPGFDPIRHDPRFQNLLRRIGLPQS